ncbi:adenylyl-sulfate kinase [Pseudomonas sp. KU26590]|uniref:adenylyl-sulfate kinase n=1 Tax=Pseudomonas sp. KU26590 TaxID=2991051 RepID=UPI00223E098C|nr:adenylyl-sulfate kinase [Pseudomonas sp. KU26590]UZJ61122.1 adenylyl-sulfate kinase [Pseudomonas sp. KU26590]
MKQGTSNLTWHTTALTREDRQSNLHQTAMTIWLTGLSGSGKSSLAFGLESSLAAQGKSCFVLDGDNIRHGLCSDLGFTLVERCENIRRIAEVSKLMNDAGLIVIVAIISPLIEHRTLASNIIGTANFHEIYVSTPLDICEKRDPKGLYLKARRGSLGDFTGVSSPYIPPPSPRLVIDNTNDSIEANIKRLSEYLEICNNTKTTKHPD